MIESDQWAQKVLVSSDRQMDRHSHAVHMYICVPFPPSLSDCINLISLGNQAEKRSGGKSNKILFSSSAATAKSTCPMFGVLCTVLVTVQPEGYHCFEEDEIM